MIADAETNDMVTRTGMITGQAAVSHHVVMITRETSPMAAIGASMMVVGDVGGHTHQATAATTRTTTGEEVQAPTGDLGTKANSIFLGGTAPMCQTFKSFSSQTSTATLSTGWNKPSRPRV